MIQLHKTKPEFTETYLRRLAVTNFGAGHETMCSALTSTMAMIGSHPSTQRRVAHEVRASTDSTADPMSYTAVARLPFTQATIKEAQRLYPVIGMSLPRRVPAGTTGMRAHGHHFPPGTTVGCNPASLHRNADIFGVDAGEFNPDRWLRPGGDVRAMERYNLTWGGGARRCPGRHLAEMIVYKVVAALVREFDLEVRVPPEEEMPVYFMAMLTGVKVRFLPRRGDGP